MCPYYLHPVARVVFGLRFVLQAHPVTLGLLCSSCSSGQDFAVSFLQIPPPDGHPCSWLTLPTVKVRLGLAPYSYRPCRTHKEGWCVP